MNSFRHEKHIANAWRVIEHFTAVERSSEYFADFLTLSKQTLRILAMGLLNTSARLGCIDACCKKQG